MVLKGLIGIILILGIGVTYLQTKTEGTQAFVDNFFSNKEAKAYYVVTNKGEKKGDNYLYMFNAYDEQGDQQVVKKLVDRELREGAYLKIYAKGMQGKGWGEVKTEEVPAKALEKLKK